MDVITSTVRDGQLMLFAHNRIDSDNAPAASAMIEAALAENPQEDVFLDVEDLEYISSAGLRAVLSLRKKRPKLEITNAKPEIYEILDMTGFTEMIPVHKAYRRFNVDGCTVIGNGANGIVYRYDKDTIIKVFRSHVKLEDIQRERDLARRAFVLGIPTAIAFDVVKVGDAYGSVFEMLDCMSLTKHIQKEPEKIDDYVDVFVDLLKKIHSTAVKPGDMPDMKPVAVNWVSFLQDYLPEAAWKKLYDLVTAVPQDEHMIHGDYHANNVMMQGDEPLLIDMDTIARGSRIFEFASVYNAYVGFGAVNPQVLVDFQGLPVEICHAFWDKVIRRYFNTDDPETLQQITDKSMLMGYARLMRRGIRRGFLNSEEGERTIAVYRDGIIRLVETVDSLVL